MEARFIEGRRSRNAGVVRLGLRSDQAAQVATDAVWEHTMRSEASERTEEVRTKASARVMRVFRGNLGVLLAVVGCPAARLLCLRRGGASGYKLPTVLAVWHLMGKRLVGGVERRLQDGFDGMTANGCMEGESRACQVASHHVALPTRPSHSGAGRCARRRIACGGC